MITLKNVSKYYYNKGIIYRGEKLINWDPAAGTALSNEEVVYSEEMPMTPDKGRAVPSGKRQTPGSISFVPPVAGMIIGGEVIKDLIGINK